VILLLFEYLSSIGVKIPSVFYYSSTRMILAAMTTLACTILLGPRFIKRLYALKTGQSIRVEDCPPLAELHQKKKETPTMGGILILFSMTVALFLWMDITSSFTLILLVTTVWLGLVGGVDDYLKLKYKNSQGMKAKKKFLAQATLGGFLALYLLWPQATEMLKMKNHFHPPIAKEQISIVKEDQSKVEVATISLNTNQYMSRYYIPFSKEPIFTLSGAFLGLGFLSTIFVVTGCSNAVNLTDGLDGLAAGCIVMVSFVLGLVAFLSNNIEISRYLNILYIEGSGEIAIYLFALIGACLGFLWYNSHPAQVFMGDVGSLALGGVIGVSAVLLRREILLALIGGIFVAEALSVILQVGSYKMRDRKRIFLCAPLHHHFEYKGWPETKVVLRFWIVGLILAIVGIASLKFQ
jgi:phospho-N-acetylmuramoyl-pentapeptide-transferase